MPGRKMTSPTKLYPFVIMIKSAHGDLRGQILKLTNSGFLAEVPESKLQPGDTVTLSFELGAAGRVSGAPGRIVKYYSQWSVSPQNGAASHAHWTASSAGPMGSQKLSADNKTPGGKAPAPAGSARIGHLLEIHFLDLPISVVESISTFLRSSSKISRR